MNPAAGLLPVERFVKTLHIVWREGEHLSYSWHRLFPAAIDTAWVTALAQAPEAAERMDAFVSRFGRMQDTIADKLPPRITTHDPRPTFIVAACLAVGSCIHFVYAHH